MRAARASRNRSVRRRGSPRARESEPSTVEKKTRGTSLESAATSARGAKVMIWRAPRGLATRCAGKTLNPRARGSRGADRSDDRSRGDSTFEQPVSNDAVWFGIGILKGESLRPSGPQDARKSRPRKTLFFSHRDKRRPLGRHFSLFQSRISPSRPRVQHQPKEDKMVRATSRDVSSRVALDRCSSTSMPSRRPSRKNR